MTNQYNDALMQHLPGRGITLREIPRLKLDGTPVSASAVRAHLKNGNFDGLKQLLPETTYEYLKTHDLLK